MIKISIEILYFVYTEKNLFIKKRKKEFVGRNVFLRLMPIDDYFHIFTDHFNLNRLLYT